MSPRKSVAFVGPDLDVESDGSTASPSHHQRPGRASHHHAGAHPRNDLESSMAVEPSDTEPDYDAFASDAVSPERNDTESDSQDHQIIDPSSPPSAKATMPPKKASINQKADEKMSTRNKRKPTGDAYIDAQFGASPTKKARASKATATKATPARIRKSSEQLVDSMSIPKTIEEMGEADQMIWAERKKGKGWSDIREEWFMITGQRPGSTTLPNRLTRIRENIGDFNNDDDRLLVKCKREIDETFANDVWAIVAEQMVIKGGGKFTAVSVKKRYAELMVEEIKDDDEVMNEEGAEDDAGGVALALDE